MIFQYNVYRMNELTDNEGSDTTVECRHQSDVESSDTAVEDTHQSDVESSDTAVEDTHQSDVESSDTAVEDTHQSDVESSDSAVEDTHQSDVESSDTAVEDTHQSDVESSDTAVEDTHQSDVESSYTAVDDTYKSLVDDAWFWNKLQEFPCMFFVKDSTNGTTIRLREILTLKDIAKMHHDLSDKHNDIDEFDSELEETFEVLQPVREHLSVVFHWLLHREEEAVERAASIAREHVTSILARANRMYVLWERGEKDMALLQMKELLDLKNANQKRYKKFELTGRAQVAYGYKLMGTKVMPFALRLLQEVMDKRPKEPLWKFIFAMHVRTSVRKTHQDLHPDVSSTNALVMALGKLVGVMNSRKATLMLKARATAEIGFRINFLKDYNKTNVALANKARHYRLDARECFEKALQFDAENTSVLRMAGTFYRYKKELDRSVALLKKSILLKPTPDSHYHLSLSYKKFISKENEEKKDMRQHNTRHVTGHSRQTQGRSSRTSIALIVRSPQNEKWKRCDPWVVKTIEHMEKAVELSCGRKIRHTLDLGTMYKAVGEYDKALTVFELALENEFLDCANTFEQSGLVYLEMSKLLTKEDEKEEEKEEKKKEKRYLKRRSNFMLRSALICQCHLVESERQYRNPNSDIWHTISTLATHIQSDTKLYFSNENLKEDWLLELIKRYVGTVPVLREVIRHRSEEMRLSLEYINMKLSQYVVTGRFHDAVLFLCLLRLTNEREFISSIDDDFEVKQYINAARSLLLSEARRNDNSLSTHAARRLFYRSFAIKHASPSNLITSLEGWHAMILCDRSDDKAGQCMTTVHHLLEETCGLDVALMPREVDLRSEVKEAHQLLVIVTKQTISAEFEQCLKDIQITSSCNNEDGISLGRDSTPHPVTAPVSSRIATLAMNTTSVPDVLKDFPLLLWQQETLDLCSAPKRSLERVNPLCELFSFLLGIRMNFPECIPSTEQTE